MLELSSFKLFCCSKKWMGFMLQLHQPNEMYSFKQCYKRMMLGEILIFFFSIFWGKKNQSVETLRSQISYLEPTACCVPSIIVLNKGKLDICTSDVEYGILSLFSSFFVNDCSLPLLVGANRGISSEGIMKVESFWSFCITPSKYVWFDLLKWSGTLYSRLNYDFIFVCESHVL